MIFIHIQGLLKSLRGFNRCQFIEVTNSEKITLYEADSVSDLTGLLEIVCLIAIS